MGDEPVIKVKALMTLSPESLPFYTGETCIHDFLAQIEEVSILAEWEDAHRLAIPKLKLKGVAREALNADNKLKECNDWEEFKTLLIDRFQKTKIPGQAAYVFRQCTQLEGESVREFIARLRVAANNMITWSNNQAKNDFLREKMNEDALQQLFEGLSPNLSLRVMTHNPKTFTEACEIALREEINLVRVKKRQTNEESVGKYTQGDLPDLNYTRYVNNQKPNQQTGNSGENTRRFPYSTSPGYQNKSRLNKNRGNSSMKFDTARYRSPSPNPNRARPQSVNKFSGQRAKNRNPVQEQPPRYESNRSIECFKCFRKGHFARNCNTKCYNCNNIGHISRNCNQLLNSKQVAFRLEEATS